jgi:hypothetical protein
VVVVVTGPGTAGCVVCSDVVVVLPEGAGADAVAGVDDVAHADNAAMATARRLGRINFFMVVFSVSDFCFAPPSSHNQAHGDYGVLPAGGRIGPLPVGAPPQRSLRPRE